MTYDQLLPAAQKVLAVPTVGGYYRDRYAAIICDEFQDTNDAEWSFMQAIAPGAQRVLLGDLNQCIYAGMKNIDPTARIAQATAQANAILAKLNPAFELAVEGVIRDLVTHSTPKLNVDGLLEAIRSAHHRLGFPRGEETWNLANQYLRRAARGLASNGSVETLAIEVERTRVDTLVEFMSGRTKRVQVMNLHQTKGDATVLLLQEDEYHGREREQYPTGSRLLYVCLTRARERAHIVVPDVVHPLWLPLVNECIKIGNAAQP